MKRLHRARPRVAVGFLLTTAAPLMLLIGFALSQPTQLTNWGGVGALYYYGSFPEWRANVLAQGSSLAVVRITGVSDFRWSTGSSAKPGQPEIDMINRGEATFGIGRIVTAELVRQLDGTWPSGAATADFFLPGGQLGTDYTSPSELLHHLPDPAVGGLALATLLPQPVDIDYGSGSLVVEIGALFPVSKAGHVLTPDHLEVLQVDKLPVGE